MVCFHPSPNSPDSTAKFLKATKRVGNNSLEERLHTFFNYNARYIERWQKQHGKRSLCPSYTAVSI